MRRGAVVFVMVTLLVSRAHWFADAVQFPQHPPVQLSIRRNRGRSDPRHRPGRRPAHRRAARRRPAARHPRRRHASRRPRALDARRSRPSSASPAARWSRPTSSSPARATSRCARARRPAWPRSSADVRVRPARTGPRAGPMGRMPRRARIVGTAGRRARFATLEASDGTRGDAPADRPAAGPPLDRAHRHARVALGVAARRIARHPVGVAAAVRRRGAPRAGRRPPPPGPRRRVRGRRRGRHGGHQRGARARGIRTGLARRRRPRDRRRASRVPLGAAHARTPRRPHAAGGRRRRRDRGRGTATDAAGAPCRHGHAEPPVPARRAPAGGRPAGAARLGPRRGRHRDRGRLRQRVPPPRTAAARTRLARRRRTGGARRELLEGAHAVASPRVPRAAAERGAPGGDRRGSATTSRARCPAPRRMPRPPCSRAAPCAGTSR